MNNIFENYKIISLGYDCTIKMTWCKNQETHFFDYIGSSMWSINKLLQNKFEDSLNLDLFKNIEILNGMYSMTNKKYYLRFHHDFKFTAQIGQVKKMTMRIPEEIKDNFVEKYTRRINRFYDLLNGNEKVLFIRKEEDLNRIKYPEYNEYIKYSEIYYIKQFIKIIQEKFPKLKFKIIFISFSQETQEEPFLLVIKTDLQNLMKFSTLITNFLKG